MTSPGIDPVLKKGLRGRISPTCTLSQNGYGAGIYFRKYLPLLRVCSLVNGGRLCFCSSFLWCKGHAPRESASARLLARACSPAPTQRRRKPAAPFGAMRKPQPASVSSGSPRDQRPWGPEIPKRNLEILKSGLQQNPEIPKQNHDIYRRNLEITMGGLQQNLEISKRNLEIPKQNLEISKGGLQQNLEISKQNLEISKQNLEISKQNLEISNQNLEITKGALQQKS